MWNGRENKAELLLRFFGKIPCALFLRGADFFEQAANHAYGDRYIDEVAKFIAQNYPDLRGFNRRGLYRMRQFYETYRDDSIVSPLVTQIS